jgi:hypothetical protein
MKLSVMPRFIMNMWGDSEAEGSLKILYIDAFEHLHRSRTLRESQIELFLLPFHQTLANQYEAHAFGRSL